jgi:hypothetical protein
MASRFGETEECARPTKGIIGSMAWFLRWTIGPPPINSASNGGMILHF